MRRFLSARRSPERATVSTTASPETGGEWFDQVLASASEHGAFPYVVEGYEEVYEAVRRGHSVLLKREPAEVAEGITVFAEPAAPAGDDAQMARRLGEAVVTVTGFDVRTARFSVQDTAGVVGSAQLTPKRLERYLASPQRRTGVALG